MNDHPGCVIKIYDGEYKCGTCACFKILGQHTLTPPNDRSIGECRRHAPIAYAEFGVVHTAFPHTYLGDCCGEWVQK